VAGGKIEARVVVIMVLTIFVALRIKCLISSVYWPMHMKTFESYCGSSIEAADLRVQSKTTVFSTGRAVCWQEFR
jgi:hypothetical protein